MKPQEGARSDRRLTKGVGATRMIHAGRAPETVVRCGLAESIGGNVGGATMFAFDQAVDEDRLADGLARALDHLPIFAGRLRRREEALEIVCVDAGVPITTFDVDMTLEQVIETALLSGPDLVDPIDVESALSGSSPLLTVQVNRLSDGGMALGVAWHHLVGDMQTLMLLMRSWSAFVEGTAPPEVTIIEDRDAYLDVVLPPEDTGRSNYRLMGPDEAVEMRAEFERAARTTQVLEVYFGESEVDRMRKQFGAEMKRRLSANDVLCAHLLNTLCLLAEDTETRRLNFPVDIRPLLGLPSSVVGNILTLVSLPRAPNTRPAVLAGAVRDAVESVRSHLNLRADRAFAESCDRSQPGALMFLGIDPANHAVLITNWCAFGHYKITFALRRPAFFCPVLGSGQLPWRGILFKGFGDSGYLCTLSVPARLAELLRRPEGNVVLHRFRESGDVLPALATSVLTLV